MILSKYFCKEYHIFRICIECGSRYFHIRSDLLDRNRFESDCRWPNYKLEAISSIFKSSVMSLMILLPLYQQRPLIGLLLVNSK